MRIIQKMAIIFIVVFHLLILAFINYAMPSYKGVNIVGVEVKRMDNKNIQNDTQNISKDTYFIYVNDINSDKSRVYKNEDTRFGFPFYFKFNSADIQANATNFIDKKATVQIKYYGWRINFLDKFPNIISIKKIDDVNNTSMPIFSYIFYFITLISMIYSIIFIKKKFKKKIEL